jgi:hypothetical protein
MLVFFFFTVFKLIFLHSSLLNDAILTQSSHLVSRKWQAKAKYVKMSFYLCLAKKLTSGHG